MDPQGTTPLDRGTAGYPRTSIDEFLAAVDVEAQRLVDVVAAAQARTRRALAAIGTHRVMVAMVLDAQREVDELRTGAQTRAERILAAAEDEANEIVRRESATARHSATARNSAANGEPWSRPWAPMDLAPKSGSIDGELPQVAMMDLPTPSAEEEHADNQYFEFLRQALTDHEPLGPR